MGDVSPFVRCLDITKALKIIFSLREDARNLGLICSKLKSKRKIKYIEVAHISCKILR